MNKKQLNSCEYMNEDKFILKLFDGVRKKEKKKELKIPLRITYI